MHASSPHKTGSFKTMRSAVVTAPRQVELREVVIPDPGPYDVRVRLSGCGVCASNVLPWTGPEWMNFPTEPGALGHEGWGVADAVGTQVRTVREGDPVATLFQNSYAEFDVGPASGVIVLPETLQGTSFPGEPLGCAINIIKRAKLKPGDYVAVIGLGFLGLLLVRLAAVAGAIVVGIGRKSDARERALELGAKAAVTPNSADHAEWGDLAFGGFDCVIEATGHAAPLDLAGRLIKTRGKLVIAGYHQDGLRQVDMQLWNWKGLDVINAHERDPAIYAEGVHEAILLVMSGRLDPEPLLTHSFRLENLNEALGSAEARPAGFVKAVVVMQ